MDKHITAKVLSVCLIFMLAGVSIGYVYAQSSSNFMTITGGIYPGAETYTISVTDGVYYAKNAYGIVTESSDDSNTVINAVIAEISTGGTIKCVGTITISETLTLDFADKIYNFYFETITLNGDFDGLRFIGTNQIKTVNIEGIAVLFPSGYTSSAITLKNVAGLTLKVNKVYPSSGVGATGSVCVHLLGENAGCWYNNIFLNMLGATETGVLLESSGEDGFVNSNAIYNAHANYINYGFKTLNNGANVAGNKFYNCVFEPITVTGSVRAFSITDSNNDFYGCATIDMSPSHVDVYVSADGTAKFFGGQLANQNFDSEGVLEFVSVDGVTPAETVKIANFYSWTGNGTHTYHANAINLYGANTAGSAVYVYTRLNMLFQNDGWNENAFPFNKVLTVNFGFEVHDGVTSGTERYVQIKASSAIGDLDGIGVGIYVNGDKLYGEAFGTARQTTTEYYTLTPSEDVKVTIFWVLGTDTVTYYINGVKLGSLTGTAVHSNGILYPKFFISGENGVNNEYTSMTVGNIEISRGY